MVPGEPHHITQRGNRPQPTLFGDEDCAAYLELVRTGRPLGSEESVAGLEGKLGRRLRPRRPGRKRKGRQVWCPPNSLPMPGVSG